MVYTLKSPYRYGTTQVTFDPVDFIAQLAALIPKPRVNLTRYHGVLACAPKPPLSRAGNASKAQKRVSRVFPMRKSALQGSDMRQ